MMQVQTDKALIPIPFVGGFVSEIVVVTEVLYWHQGDLSENSPSIMEVHWLTLTPTCFPEF